jgi:hypothetical protein
MRNLIGGIIGGVVAIAIYTASLGSVEEQGAEAFIEHLETKVYVGAQVTLIDYTSVALKSGINKVDLQLSISKDGYDFPQPSIIYTYGNSFTGGGWSTTAAGAIKRSSQ